VSGSPDAALPVGPGFITRDWILEAVPLRKVERQIGLALRHNRFSGVLEGVLRKGFTPREDVGIVDVDVELGKFHVHQMEEGTYYLEAVYAGEIDVDVKVKESEYLPYAGYKTKSFMMDIEVIVEIDVRGKRVASFEVIESEVF
jgi:hypothetical protein